MGSPDCPPPEKPAAVPSQVVLHVEDESGTTRTSTKLGVATLVTVVASACAGRTTAMGTRASDWKEKPRALNRGAAAWNSTPLTAKEAIATVANRLHVHAIADASNLSAYLPALRKWLDFVEESGAMVLETWQKDEALASYLAHLCYDTDAGIQTGKNAIAGFQHVFPEEADLPRANRALIAWTRLAITGEGTAVPWEGAFAISHTMRKLGHEESADIVLIMADSYMRQGDWKMIQPEDITEEGQSVAISLGVAERGEATKTGFRQGVRIGRAFVAEIAKKHKRAMLPDNVLRIAKQYMRPVKPLE